MIDTHVHINQKDLYTQREEVMARAAAQGVESFVVVGYDLASSAQAVELATTDTRIFATVGIHPHDALNWNAESERQIREWLDHPRVIAVGEIGLDYYRDLSPRDRQETAFLQQLAIARTTSFPVIIHCRDAYPETLALLEANAGDTSIILHCYQGDMAQAERSWARGWFLGIGGSVTFKNSQSLRSIVRAAPQESLLLETDAPYLSPVPFRGKYPNEPSRLPAVIAKIAEVRGESVEVVAEYTTANARRAFPRLGKPR